jgi:hypothetical protein
MTARRDTPTDPNHSERLVDFLKSAVGEGPSYTFVGRDPDGNRPELRAEITDIPTGCSGQLEELHQRGASLYVSTDFSPATKGVRFACVTAQYRDGERPKELPPAHECLDIGGGELLDVWRIAGGITLADLRPITEAIAKKTSANPILDPTACLPLPGYDGVKSVARAPHIPAITVEQITRQVCGFDAVPSQSEASGRSLKAVADVVDVPRHFRDLKEGSNGYLRGRCPAHGGDGDSLSVWQTKGGRWRARCFSRRCSEVAIFAAVGLSIEAIEKSGLTLEDYAEAKGLPVEFLQKVGVGQIALAERPAVRMTYYDEDGNEAAVRFQVGLYGKNLFRWRRASKASLYGLQRMARIRKLGAVVLVEGESDWQTLRYHNFNALGLPGAGLWDEQRDAKLLHGIKKIYFVIQPDHGGKVVESWIAASSIRDRVLIVELPDGCKDVNELHLLHQADAEAFKDALRDALDRAQPWATYADKARQAIRKEAWQECRGLAECEDILSELDRPLKVLGLVGERKVARLIYLTMTSRVFGKPVSAVVKGTSSGGKSFTVETVTKFFPPEAYYARTSISPHALAYGTESLRHRHIILYEAQGVTSEMGAYFLRTLLTEHCIAHETVEKTKDGLKPKTIRREGPTGAILTTIKLGLDPELETRILSLTINDTREQTQGVLRRIARGPVEPPDLSKWIALQRWIAAGTTAVVIPYAGAIAELVVPVAVRLRRDFSHVLRLVMAHALLHQATRKRDQEGRVVAGLRDYAAVRDLAGDWIAAGVGAGVPETVRQTVEAVERLLERKSPNLVGEKHVLVSELVGELKLDRSTTARRVAEAVERGFLRDLEERPGQGRKSRLTLGDPMPKDKTLLPDPDDVLKLWRQLRDDRDDRRQ